MAQSSNSAVLQDILQAGSERRGLSGDEATASQVSDLGALVQLGIPCSTIRRIYYAKVWRQVRDLLLVRDRSFEIYRLDSELKLQFIASQNNFDGIIKSSLVLPEPADLELQGEEDVLNEQNNSGGSRLPPQILVYVLQETVPQQQPQRQLVLTFPYLDETMKIKFAAFKHPIPNISYNTMGINMTSETKGRLLAVAGQSGAFSLYKLKPWIAIRDFVEQNNATSKDKFNPILEERLVILEDDYLIWHTEFVTSPASEYNLAYLIMIVESTHKHATLMLVYKIDCTRPLKTQTLKPLRQDRLGGIPETHGLDRGLFVIPLQNTSGIILGAEDGFALISDIRQPEFLKHPYLTSLELKNGTKSSSKLLYTTWAQSYCHRTNWEDVDTELIYMARQDGQVILLTVQSRPGGTTFEVTSFGCINSSIDKAFAVVDLLGDEYPIFITGGSHSNGAVVSIEPNRPLEFRAVIPNTESIIDTALVPCWNYAPNGWKRIFATSNRGRKHGSISEMRYGFEIRVLESINTADEIADSIVINKAWILPHDGEDYLITATLNGSACQLYQFNKSKVQDQGSAKAPCWSLVDRNSNHPWFSIFEDDEETITITLTRHAYYLRVTRSNIQQFSFDLATRKNLLAEEVQDFRIVSAVIDSYNARILFVVARNTSYSLCYLTSYDDQPPTIRSRILDNEPSCIYIHNEDAFALAVLSTQESELEFYDLNGPEITILSSHKMRVTDGACESLIVLSKGIRDVGHGQGLSLMCGFRSGLLRRFSLVIKNHSIPNDGSSPKDIVLMEHDSIFLGLTSVQIMPNYKQEMRYSTATSAFIFCEEILYVFEENGHKFTESNLKQLWYTDSKGNGLHQPAILSMAVIPSWIQSVYFDTEDVFCVTRDTIHRCRVQLDGEPRNVPWQIRVGGSPHRILWSDHHKRLVVGLTLELRVDATQSSKSKDSRPFFFSAITIINPNRDEANQIKPEHEIPVDLINEQSTYAAIIEPSGARISSLAEWEIVRNGRVYHMLLVSILETASGGGKIHIFNFKTAEKPLELKATYRAKEKGPVYAVAVYDSTSIIALTNHYLVQLQLSSESDALHFRETISTKLNSPGTRHLRIHQDQIIIGTETYGLEIYTIRNQTFKCILSDTTGGLTSDSITIATSHSLSNITVQLRHPPDIEISSSQISAYHQGPQHLTPLFTCPIPSYITSLQQTSLRSPIRENAHLPYPRISAFAIDGAIYSLDMIPLPVWRVLKLLQKLIERDGTLCQFGSAVARYRGVVPDDRIMEERHVDGDVLRRLLRMDEDAARSFVRQLVGGDIASLMHEWMREVIGQDEIDRVGGIAEAVFGLVTEVVDAP